MRGNPRSEQQMENFRASLDHGNLQDRGFEGDSFTWCNGRDGANCIMECLDCFVANKDWQLLNPSWKVYNRGVAYSDHRPILLTIGPMKWIVKRKKLLCFEAMWTSSSNCRQIIVDVWKNHAGRGDLHGVMTRIRWCNDRLETWNKMTFSSVKRKLNLAYKRLNILLQKDPLCQNMGEHRAARREVQKWLEREEILWRQRSRIS